MASPLIDELISKHGYPLLTEASSLAFIEGEGARVLFLSGDPDKLLESNDVAVILPQLVAAFAHHGLRPGVVARPLEKSIQTRFDIWPLPSLIFLRDGRLLGAIPKVRDWEDYLQRIAALLNQPAVA